MTGQGPVGDSAPPKHAVRVDWFGRDPGGGTIYVMPPQSHGAALQPGAERDDEEAAQG